VSEELDELIAMASPIRMTPEQGNPTSRKARDMGHPRRSFAYGNVKIENDSITWDMIDRAAERLERREVRAGGVLFGWSGGLAVPESFFCCLRHD
jgi:hypothetical protein